MQGGFSTQVRLHVGWLHSWGEGNTIKKKYCNWCISDISTIATLGFLVHDPIGKKELMIFLNGHKDFAIDNYCSCISICVSMRMWYANMQYILTFVLCLDNLNKNTDLGCDSSFPPGAAVFCFYREDDSSTASMLLHFQVPWMVIVGLTREASETFEQWKKGTLVG